MLFRLRPPTDLMWCQFSAWQLREIADNPNVDLDRLDWLPTETFTFSEDLLRLAVRHGVATAQGIVLDASLALDLGRADELRLSQLSVDEATARIPKAHEDLMERLMPGWKASGMELADRVREATEQTAREAEADLEQELAAPVRQELAEHWLALGGRLAE